LGERARKKKKRERERNDITIESGWDNLRDTRDRFLKAAVHRLSDPLKSLSEINKDIKAPGELSFYYLNIRRSRGAASFSNFIVSFTALAGT
jgi:hypothetical protein